MPGAWALVRTPGQGETPRHRASVARGTFGSPTFFVGDEIFFGKDRLRDVEEMILATR
jgi:2-hydroxychromene-2-carboxylate isomerase